MSEDLNQIYCGRSLGMNINYIQKIHYTLKKIKFYLLFDLHKIAISLMGVPTIEQPATNKTQTRMVDVPPDMNAYLEPNITQLKKNSHQSKRNRLSL
jgi:hypothetical protein